MSTPHQGSVVMECAICRSGRGQRYRVREMMFGLRDEFEYFGCEGCGCLQILDPPRDLARYYPPAYYSFAAAPSSGGVRGWMRRRRNRAAFTGDGVLGRLLRRAIPYPYSDVGEWLQNSRVGFDSRILDVGCGNAMLLRDLADAGFRNLLGVDPFIEAGFRYGDALEVRRASVEDLAGTFDLIMFHHSLEHMPDQHGSLAAAARLLAPHGVCLVRVPVASSLAWERYRESWFQIDAPRHFFVHTTTSLQLAAGGAGLTVANVQHDSNELQFLVSEAYRRDVPLAGAHRLFSRTEVRHWRRQAEALNRAGRGDQAAFYLVRREDGPPAEGGLNAMSTAVSDAAE